MLIFTCELDNKRIKNRHQNNLLERAEFVFVFLEFGFALSQFRQIYVIIIRSWVHPLVNSGFAVTQSLVLYACFVDRCLIPYTDPDYYYLFGIFKLYFHEFGFIFLNYSHHMSSPCKYTAVFFRSYFDKSCICFHYNSTQTRLSFQFVWVI